MDKWLETAMDCGISETDFWSMTIGEVTRVIESFIRKEKRTQQEKASFDYMLAQLITAGISGAIGGGKGMPEIYEAYPRIFNAKEIEEERQKKIDELSALRFKQFAKVHNSQLEV